MWINVGGFSSSLRLCYEYKTTFQAVGSLRRMQTSLKYGWFMAARAEILLLGSYVNILCTQDQQQKSLQFFFFFKHP